MTKTMKMSQRTWHLKNSDIPHFESTKEKLLEVDPDLERNTTIHYSTDTHPIP